MEESRKDIGVIIGRFQIDRLHEGHIALLDHVTKHHKKVIVFLGVAPGEHKEDQALGYATREKMVKTAYPEVLTSPLKDINDDNLWSSTLDTTIRNIYHHGSVMLYGGRDSFIPHYHGKFPIEEISNAITETATDRRNQIKREVRDTEDFRAGILYHASNTYPNVFPAVDVAIFNNDTNEILLGRKPNETLFRFPGGHVDPTDETYEAAALREAHEECGGIELSNPRYVASMRVDDWRYKKSKNKIHTILYTVDYSFGKPEASDDIEEVKWFKFKDLSTKEQIIANIVPEHCELFFKLNLK